MKEASSILPINRRRVQRRTFKKKDTYFKLTDENMQTYNGFAWKLGEWEAIQKENQGGELCTAGWFHCYDDPVLAILLNPVHARIEHVRLFRCETAGRARYEQLKYGFTDMCLVREIAVPVLKDADLVEVRSKLLQELYFSKSMPELGLRRVRAGDDCTSVSELGFLLIYASESGIDVRKLVKEVV